MTEQQKNNVLWVIVGIAWLVVVCGQCLGCATLAPRDRVNSRFGPPAHLCSPQFVGVAQDEPRYEELRPYVVDAVEEWNDRLGYRLLFWGGQLPLSSIEDHDGVAILVYLVAPGEAAPGVNTMAAAYMAYDEIGCVHPKELTVDERLLGDPVHLREALRHELGHFLGLAHSPIPDAIMAGWSSTHRRHITDIEVRTVLDSHGLLDRRAR